MDALALLCTLHADGPSTLKNLRQAGCGSLEAIESMEEERLSKVLGGPPAVARRFAREARHLRERLDPGILDREETHVDSSFGPADLAADADESVLAARPEAFDLAARLGLSNLVPASKPREQTSSGALEATTVPARSPSDVHRDPMADVLEAWRDRDQVETRDLPVAGPLEAIEAVEEETPPRPARARPEFEFGAEIVAVMRQLASTATPGAPIPSALPEGAVASPLSDEPLLEGLSTLFEDHGIDLALRLGEEGIRDLRELTDADVLALSERLGFGYTRILRVVQLARRAAAGPIEPSGAAFGAGVLGISVVPASASVVGVSDMSGMSSTSGMSRASGVRETESLDKTSKAPAELELEPKISPADRPRPLRPSILDLEWNLELQPQARPPGHQPPDSKNSDARSESAGGPFA